MLTSERKNAFLPCISQFTWQTIISVIHAAIKSEWVTICSCSRIHRNGKEAEILKGLKLFILLTQHVLITYFSEFRQRVINHRHVNEGRNSHNTRWFSLFRIKKKKGKKRILSSPLTWVDVKQRSNGRAGDVCRMSVRIDQQRSRQERKTKNYCPGRAYGCVVIMGGGAREAVGHARTGKTEDCTWGTPEGLVVFAVTSNQRSFRAVKWQ